MYNKLNLAGYTKKKHTSIK